MHNNIYIYMSTYGVLLLLESYVVGRGYHSTTNGRALCWTIHFISEYLSRSKAISAEDLSINDQIYRTHARLQVNLVMSYNIHVMCVRVGQSHSYNY